MKINSNSDGITIEGYTGTWYVIDTNETPFGDLFLLESEVYGDETASLIVDENGLVLLDYVWNGFDDLFEGVVLQWVKGKVLRFFGKKREELKNKQCKAFDDLNHEEWVRINMQLELLSDLGIEFINYNLAREE